MRYIKPPDFKSVKDLEAHYKKIEEQISTILTDGSAKSSKELSELLSNALSSAVSFLSKENKAFTSNELPTAFKEGKDSVKEPVVVTAKEASSILAQQGFRYATNAFSYDTYIELQTSLNDAVNSLKKRVNKTIEELRKKGSDSVFAVKQAIEEEFTKNGILKVMYSNGAKMPLSAYAAMVARSARIESINIGAIGRALQAGTDLVIMTEVPQCCKTCGAYQGKVYSISGKDKRFPALFKTVLKSGYALPHPNCRHEFIPWFSKMEDPADVNRMISRSKIKYDKHGNLIDVRFQSDIQGYAEWQAGNRQRNTEYLEYEAMRRAYAGREDEMPYKTLAGFRRARRAQAESYKDNRKDWNSMQEIAANNLTDWKLSGRIGIEPNPNAKKDCAVSWKAINTKAHNDGIRSLVGNNSVIGKAISNIETEILKHRQGTEYEDLYLIDSRTGKVVAKNTTSQALLKVSKTKEMEDALSAIDERSYILVHNHPYSSPPSVADLNSLFKNPKIQYGIIIGHNGIVYKYTAPSMEIDEKILDIALQRYRNMKYTQDTSLKMAYDDLSKKFRFNLEVIQSGKK